MSDDYEFSLVIGEQPITLKTSTGEKKWMLREMSGEQRDLYLTRMQERFEIGDDGKVLTITTFDGHQSNLLASCLFDENNNPVDERVIQQFPARTQQALFDLASKMNGLDKKAIETAKNG